MDQGLAMNGYLGALQDVPERWKPVSGMLHAQMFNTRSIICTLAIMHSPPTT